MDMSHRSWKKAFWLIELASDRGKEFRGIRPSVSRAKRAQHAGCPGGVRCMWMAWSDVIRSEREGLEVLSEEESCEPK